MEAASKTNHETDATSLESSTDLEAASVAFDIDSLSSDVADELRAAEDQIQAHARHAAGSIVEIGRTLIRMRERLPHGQFLPWVTTRVEMSRSSAYRYINIAERFPDKLPTVGSLTLRTLESLASPSLPEPERVSIVADLQGAVPIDEGTVKKRIASVLAKQPSRSKRTARQIAPEPATATDERERSPSAITIEEATSAPSDARSEPRDALVAPKPRRRAGAIGKGEIGPTLFRLAERLAEAGLTDDLLQLEALIGPERLGFGLCESARGKSVDTISPPPDLTMYGGQIDTAVSQLHRALGDCHEAVRLAFQSGLGSAIFAGLEKAIVEGRDADREDAGGDRPLPR